MTNLLADKMIDTLLPYFSEEEYDKGLEEALNTFLIEVNNSEPIETTTYKSLSKTFKSIIIGFFKSPIVSEPSPPKSKIIEGASHPLVGKISLLLYN